MEKFDNLKLENQLCFPLYACSKEIIKRYKPFLDEIDLTYTQYIVMMVLWDKKQITVGDLGKYVFLDSGTLTPLLKKLESKEYINRNRSTTDERNLIVSITDLGMNLKNKAKDIPSKLGNCVNLDLDESLELYRLLYKIISGFEENK